MFAVGSHRFSMISGDIRSGWSLTASLSTLGELRTCNELSLLAKRVDLLIGPSTDRLAGASSEPRESGIRSLGQATGPTLLNLHTSDAINSVRSS